MSKENENNQPDNNSADNHPDKGKEKPALAIEEHQKNLNIDASDFESVKKIKGWKGGEKVPEEVFQKAIEEYLKASKKENVPTIEEHAKNLKVDVPIFAAVMQSNKWASGKRVPKAVFEKAVKDFLNAPMGGKNVTRN